MFTKFIELGLQADLMQAVEKLGYETPSPIQTAAIPALLTGKDVIGQAQTGTGKTAAFALPMLQTMRAERSHVQALVLAPTRELAIQVTDAISKMARFTSYRVMTVYGGQPYTVQIRQIQRGVDIVVGTPGRLLDLIRKNLLDITAVRYLVLDEADEMLEMGFIEEVEAILAHVVSPHQTMLFSATMPPPIRKLANRFMVDPLHIAIKPEQMTVAETEQRFCPVREENKLAALVRMLESEDVSSALVFARTKIRTQELTDELIKRGYPAEALHGDLSQQRRESVLNRFRSKGITLLIATDVAARGLDVDDITHVFNYDLPDNPEDYVHRIGRTGRAGRKGTAITLLTPRERRQVKVFESYTHQAMIEFAVPSREDILARRDERFLERLTEMLGKGSISRERGMIAKLENTSFDLVEIAAAAIRLARANEASLPEDVIRPVQEQRLERKSIAVERSHESRGIADRMKGYTAQGEGKSKTKPRREKGRQEEGMVRLVMNLGNAQGVRPSDVVGAIATEVGIPGRAIGEIDIHNDHTFVDVAEMHVRKVLSASTGKYRLRGVPVVLALAS